MLKVWLSFFLGQSVHHFLVELFFWLLSCSTSIHSHITISQLSHQWCLCLLSSFSFLSSLHFLCSLFMSFIILIFFWKGYFSDCCVVPHPYILILLSHTFHITIVYFPIFFLSILSLLKIIYILHFFYFYCSFFPHLHFFLEGLFFWLLIIPQPWTIHILTFLSHNYLITGVFSCFLHFYPVSSIKNWHFFYVYYSFLIHLHFFLEGLFFWLVCCSISSHILTFLSHNYHITGVLSYFLSFLFFLFF